MALLEWVQAVQQEAPAAVMGLVWTHTDLFADGVCGGADGQGGFLRVVDSADGETTSWIAIRYLEEMPKWPCSLQDVGILLLSLSKEMERRKNKEDEKQEEDLWSRHYQEEESNEEEEGGWVGSGSERGIDSEENKTGKEEGEDEEEDGEKEDHDDNNLRYLVRLIEVSIQDVQSRSAVGVVCLIDDDMYEDETIIDILSTSLSEAALIPIILVPKSNADALARPGAHLTAYPGWLLP